MLHAPVVKTALAGDHLVHIECTTPNSGADTAVREEIELRTSSRELACVARAVEELELHGGTGDNLGSSDGVLELPAKIRVPTGCDPRARVG